MRPVRPALPVPTRSWPGWPLKWSASGQTAAHHHPGLHRFFQGGSWLWAGVFGLTAACLAVLMVSEPLDVFLKLLTVATIGLIVAGAGVSVLWLGLVLRRQKLTFGFAAA